MILAAGFALASATFRAGATMPMSTVYKQCSGSNISPELHWSGKPAGTRSFALIVHDPDAPAPGGWYHWVVYNLPATASALPAGITLAQSQSGRTSFEETMYGGPCPPPGKPHHYLFTLYALNEPFITGVHLSGPALQRVIVHHVLGEAKLTGLYGR